MTPDEARVREVVGKLTKAQRAALTGAWRTPAGRMAVAETAAVRTLVALEHAGLVDDATCLTPLGLAVRAELIRQQGISHG